MFRKNVFIDKQERKENVAVLQDVLNTLNNVDTVVKVLDDKYIVFHKDEKKYEIRMTKFDTIIRAFDDDMPGALRVIVHEGVNVRAKLFLLKIALADATEGLPFERFADTVKKFKGDIDVTNKILTALDDTATNVRLVHETTVYARYIMDWHQDAHGYRTIIEFNGSVVKVSENGFAYTFDATGYMKWKFGLVRRGLDKKIKSQEKTLARSAKKQEAAQNSADRRKKMRAVFADLVFGRDRTL